jgi:hypothetical protein
MIQIESQIQNGYKKENTSVNLRMAFVVVVVVVLWTHIGHSLSARILQRYPRVCLVPECLVMKEKNGARGWKLRRIKEGNRSQNFQTGKGCE